MMTPFINHLNLFSAIIVVNIIVVASPVDMMAQGKEDSTAIHDFVSVYQQTLNNHDPAAVAALFTEDADIMMYNLPLVHGRQAIGNWWQKVWQSEFNRQEPERKGTIMLNSVRFLADDVTLANIETKTGGRDSLGNELPERKARGTWLLHRQSGNWLISAMRAMPTERDSIILGASIENGKTLRPHLRAFVKAYEDAFNSHDASAVSAFFRSDADIIVRNLPMIKGTQAIQDWWNAYFSKLRDYQALFIIDEIKTISDDVVQLNFTVTGAIPGTEDQLQPVRQTRAMWILVREANQWYIDALRVLPGEDDRIIRR